MMVPRSLVHGFTWTVMAAAVLIGRAARVTAQDVVSAQAPVDTPRHTIPGLRLTASVRQDNLDERRLIGLVRLSNRSSSRIDIAYGGCFLTFHAYRHRRDRRAVWTYPSGRYGCPLALYLMSLEPGAARTLRWDALLWGREDERLDLPAGCYYFTVQLELDRPRLLSPELPAGRLCVT
jgi:hypothetical protein